MRSMTNRVILGLLAGFVLTLGFARAENSASDQSRAVAALQEDLKTDPNNAELWLHLGFAYRKLNQIEDAQHAFEKAAALSPTGAKDANFMLGLIYESKNMKAEALRAWQNYLTVEKDPERRQMAEKHIHHLS